MKDPNKAFNIFFICICTLTVLLVGIALIIPGSNVSLSELSGSDGYQQRAPVLYYDGEELVDHTEVNHSSYTVVANNKNMEISVWPMTAQDIDGRGIVQYINFSWSGALQQDVGWIFVYGDELEDFKVEKLSDLPHYKTEFRVVYKNITVSDYISYENLGTPDSRCDVGEENNTKMFSIEFDYYDAVFCFTNSYLLEGKLEGYFNESYQVESTKKGWVDVTNSIEYMGSNLAGNEGEFYKVEDSTFNPGALKQTRWTYTPKDSTKSGKWSILAYDSNIGVVQSLELGRYALLDPWWEANWTRKKQVNVSEESTTSFTNYTVRLNVSYEANMETDFADLRFLNSTEDGELDYWFEETRYSVYAIVWVEIPTLSSGTNETIYMYYGNALASSNSNIVDAFRYGNAGGTDDIVDNFQGTCTGSTTGGKLQVVLSATSACKIDLPATYTTDTWEVRFRGDQISGSTGGIAFGDDGASDWRDESTHTQFVLVANQFSSWSGAGQDAIPGWDTDPVNYTLKINMDNLSTTAGVGINIVMENGTVLERQDNGARDGANFNNLDHIRLLGESSTFQAWDVRFRQRADIEPVIFFGPEQEDIIAGEINITQVSDNSSAVYPLINDQVLHVAYIQSNATLSSYIFSWNNSGSFVNDSAVGLTGTADWANVTKTMTNPVGTAIGWITYAVDTEGKVAGTSIQSYLIKNSVPSVIGEPTFNQSFIQQNQSVELSAVISDPDGLADIASVIGTILHGGYDENVTLTQEGATSTWSVEFSNTTQLGFYNLTDFWVSDSDNTTYYSYNNISFEVLTIGGPTVTLIHPADALTQTNSTVIFDFNVTDPFTITNVTLFINGILSETNTSGVSGQYLYQKILADGDYNYSVVAENNFSIMTYSPVRTFAIDTTAPTVSISYPSGLQDFFIVGQTTFVNYTITEPGRNSTHFDDCWYIYGQSGPVIKLTTGLDTFYGWVYIEDKDTDQINITGDYNFGFAPYVKIANNSNSKDLTDAQTIQFVVTAPFSQLFNFTVNDNGWHYVEYAYERDGLGDSFFTTIGGLTNETSINCSQNSSTFVYRQGENNITVMAQDTFDFVGNDTSEWELIFSFFNTTFINPVVEGVSNTFQLETSLNGSYSLTDALFSYNNINYTTSIDFISDIYTISSTISSPIVTQNTNFSFGYYVTVNSVVFFVGQDTQQVNNVNLTDCSLGGEVLLNMSLLDEETRTSITGDIDVNAQIINKITTQDVQTANISFDSVKYGAICLDPIASKDSYSLNVEIRYVAPGYVPEFYYIQRADLSDYPRNLSLFDLPINDSTEFEIKYQDDSLITVEGAIIQLGRKYIQNDTYEVVEAPLTSNSGTAIVHINLDTNRYRAVVVKNGTVLDIFENLVFSCENELSGQCNQDLLGTINPQNQISLVNLRDFTYSLSNAGNTITTVYSIPSGTPAEVNIQLIQTDLFGNQTICNSTITSSAGSVDCTYNNTIGDSVVLFKISKDSAPQGSQSYIIPEGSGLDWKGNNFFIVLILGLSLVGMAFSSPEWIILNSVLTLLVAGTLWLISGVNLVVGIGSLLWLLIAAGILITKISKQEDR